MTSLLKRKRSESHGKRVSFNFMDPLADMPDIGPSNDIVGDLFDLMSAENDDSMDPIADFSALTPEPSLGDLGFGLDELGDISEFLQGDPEPENILGAEDFDWPDLGGEVKSDLMWSSTLDSKDDSMNQGHPQGKRGRRRDVSVTLSECAEGFLALKDMELTTDSLQNFGPTLGSDFSFIDTPIATSESDTENASTDEEEIDVVNEDVGSSRTRIHRPKSQVRPQQSFEAGRSLLRNNRNKGQTLLKKPQQQPQQQYPVIDHLNGDHSYFLVRPKQEEDSYDEMKVNRSMTPSESSDDDSVYRHSSVTSPYNTLTNPESIDKRKIAAAVQNLIKNSSASSSSDVKFRFKMRFRSNSPARAHHYINHHHYNEPKPQQKSLLIQSRQSSHPYASAMTAASKDRLRRKSASRNTHCPPPVPVIASTPYHQATPFQGATTTTRSVKIEARGLESSPKTINLTLSSPNSKKSALSKSKSLSSEEKCREIRDLHNRMERQRRVDLKNNYDQLKERVPSLQDVDKASKLNILNKAADYCRLLVSNDIKLKRELEKEAQRNLMMKKRLSALMSQLDNGTRLSSGRLSVTKRFE